MFGILTYAYGDNFDLVNIQSAIGFYQLNTKMQSKHNSVTYTHLN